MRAASRGSSSFHGIAKEGSYALHVRRLHTASLEGVFDFHLASSDLPEVTVEVRRTIGFQTLQSSSEPTLETGSDCRELALDGHFGEIIGGNSERLRGAFKVAERLLVVKA